MRAPRDGDTRADGEGRNTIERRFFDIDRVSLTNGWGRHPRAASVEHFALDIDVRA